jgi:hypothetical protein
MATAGGADAVTWLVLVYRLPAKPAALKGKIRRMLTTVGAVYLAYAVAAVPSSGAAERAMRGVRHVITDVGGSAVLLRGQAVGGGQEMTAAFNAARDREYENIAAASCGAVETIGVMTAAGEFGYEQLRDKEAVLKRLAARLAGVRERDVLGAGQAQAAASALAGYRAALDEYAKDVYAAGNGS